MKIVHMCLSCFYIDGFSYQENELVAQHVRDGHDVLVIASTETYGADRKLSYVEPSRYLGSDGAVVVRLPYKLARFSSIARKIRMHPNVEALLRDAQPDVILFHGMCGWELLTAANYVRRHPSVRLYADSHEDHFNSARSFLSRWLLHRFFYQFVVSRSIDAIEKVLCINVESMHFVKEMYGVPATKTEYFPLGGVIPDDTQYTRLRHAIRSELGFSEAHRIFIQTGKIDRSKGLLESLAAFTTIESDQAFFLIVGHLHVEIEQEVLQIMRSDSRVRFLGWRNSSELQSILCAADVFVQPVTQSATTQMSLCCRCAIIVRDVESHRVFHRQNGWLVNDQESLRDAFKHAMSPHLNISSLGDQSLSVAREFLDYRNLAARLYR
jgi:1,2-diacylglycerol 3-alpha-glucosyltransferase